MPDVIQDDLIEDDLVLYMAIRSREDGALTRLIDEHSGRVTLIISKITQGFTGIEDSEDISQNVFLKVWNEIDKYDPSKGSFTKWINKIAKYAALDANREARRTKALFDRLKNKKVFDEGKDPVMKSFNEIKHTDQLHVLGTAFKELPDDQARHIIWHYYEGRKYQEIADMLGCSINTVKAKVRRARQKLKFLIYLNS